MFDPFRVACDWDLFPWVSPTAIHIEPLRGIATLFWKRSTSEGDTREEALANIQEAVDLYLETVEDDQPFSPDAEIAEIAV